MVDDGSEPELVDTEPRAECGTCGWTGPPTAKAAMGHATNRHPGELPAFRVVQVPQTSD